MDGEEEEEEEAEEEDSVVVVVEIHRHGRYSRRRGRTTVSAAGPFARPDVRRSDRMVVVRVLTVSDRGNLILGGEILREGREKGGKYLVTQNDTHSI